jgi:hypothetical protein
MKIFSSVSAVLVFFSCPAAFAQVNGSPEEYVVTNKAGAPLTCGYTLEGPQGAPIKKSGVIGLSIHSRQYSQVSSSCISPTDATNLRQWNWAQPLGNYDENRDLANRIDTAIWQTVTQFGDPKQLQ